MPWLHCTQAPTPSHVTPPLWLQGVSAGSGVEEAVPLAQAPEAHSFVDVGMSVSSAMVAVPPTPSQTASWQSPGVCSAAGRG